MAYEPGKLSLAFSKPGVPQMWVYGGADAVGDVDGTDYITNAAEIGMRVKDMVFVAGADAAAAAVMYVSAIDADGNGTLVDVTS